MTKKSEMTKNPNLRSGKIGVGKTIGNIKMYNLTLMQIWKGSQITCLGPMQY